MTEKETSPGRRKVHAPGGVGLLIIDMINDFAFEGGEALRAKAETVAQVVLGLRDEADRLKVPVIYVNDNSAVGGRSARRSWPLARPWRGPAATWWPGSRRATATIS